jgi:hypothetical protein
MSTEFHHYTREEFPAEFYPDPADKAAIAAGMGVTQGRVSAIEHAKPDATEPRTLAAYVEALGLLIRRFRVQGPLGAPILIWCLSLVNDLSSMLAGRSCGDMVKPGEDPHSTQVAVSWLAREHVVRHPAAHADEQGDPRGERRAREVRAVLLPWTPELTAA